MNENVEIFSNFHLSGFNHLIKTSTLPSKVKQANKTPVLRMETKIWKKKKKKNRSVSVLPNISKYLRSSCSNKFLALWNFYPRNSGVVSVVSPAHNIVFYPWLKIANQQLVKENILVCFWHNYQRHLIVLRIFICKYVSVWF